MPSRALPPRAVPANRAIRERATRRAALARRAVLALLSCTLLTPLLPASAAQAAPSAETQGTLAVGVAIEDYSPFQPQTTCETGARPGTVALRDLVLQAYPGTGDSGIVRSCATGAASEHKQGRAWDWRVSAANPADVARVDDLTGWLLATDGYGNAAAMARRLGVMYMIWNGRIWKSYQASRGWQPYSGASPHTDHVHISLSWAGAYRETSYWTGRVAPVMYAPVRPPTSSAPATATATTTVTISATTVDPRVRLDQRRAVMGSLPGPWRRQ